MTSALPLHLALMATAITLAGCAGSSDKYPSLAIRDAERVTGQFTPSAPEAEPVAPVVSRQVTADIIGRAYGLRQRFDAAETNAAQLVRAARGAGPESDSWAQALVALAELTSIRGQTAIVLADLDDLESKAATSFAPTDNIRAAQIQVAHLVKEQDAALDSLSAQLR